MVPLQIAIALLSAAPWKLARSRPTPAGMISAPASPWAARHAITHSTVGESAIIRLDSVNKAIPVSQNQRLENRSAARPKTTSVAAMTSR